MYNRNCKQLSRFAEANLLCEQKRWAEASEIYHELLKTQHPLSPYIIRNLEYLSRFSIDDSVHDDGLINVLQRLHVDNIYVINVPTQLWRSIRFFREVNKQKISVDRVDAIDIDAKEVVDYYNILKAKVINTDYLFSKFIPLWKLRTIQKNITPAACSYILTQKKIFNDAVKNRYERVLIFDDDIFFCPNPSALLSKLSFDLPKNFKILQLGASEQSDRDTEPFLSQKVSDSLYHPIPGRTCGSFSGIYDCSIYQEIIDTIEIGAAPYDNAILGYLYYKYPKDCFVIDPAICVPDVESHGSSIRKGDNRQQKQHSIRMNWDSSRFEEFNAKFVVNIFISSSEMIKNIESITNSDYVFYRFFYNSSDGLRPITTGHIFSHRAPEMLPFDAHAIDDLLSKSMLPQGDCSLFLPEDIEINQNTLLSTINEIIQKVNKTHCFSGKYKKISYFFNKGESISQSRHSIIIPSFRGAKTSFQAVKSALSQQDVDFEVIVVNDNPKFSQFSDELILLCKKYFGEKWATSLKKKLKIINHAVNRGASAARNTGFLHSTGNFISFLDDDDFYEANRLSSIDSVIKSLAPNEGAVYCGYHGAWNGQEDLSRFKNGNLIDNVLAIDYSSHYMNTNTVTFKRCVFEFINGYNESYTRHQDVELLTRFFEKFSIRSIPLFLVKNRPQAVESTFNATITNLCALKHMYIYDMRRIIRARTKEQVEKILMAHVMDIAKRSTKVDSEILYTFLNSAVHLN